MYPGTAHCQLCMHTSYRSAHQLLRNTVNSSSDPAEVISHSASPMFELDRQSEFRYSTLEDLDLADLQVTIQITIQITPYMYSTDPF